MERARARKLGLELGLLQKKINPDFRVGPDYSEKIPITRVLNGPTQARKF